MKTLILGGVRSGKSRHAQVIAEETGLPVTFLATAQTGDAEMAARIETHRAHRPPGWCVIEEPLHLARALDQWRSTGGCLIVECLTLWLTNLLCDTDPTLVKREADLLVEIYSDLPGEVIVVGNETNMGVIPTGEISRRYCDIAGALHQTLAALSDRVILTVAGLPQVLKG